ncbi:MAG: CPBP family intramembrane glutamic endopeptidase [Candidatus Aerophobetes bacterium]|nr:CPBP family intramembrane glutamic endopeptidase [Candidatus Aerophobetes bacterium]
MNEKAKKIGLFIGITFFLSWVMAILFFALGGRWNTPSAMIMATSYMFFPMISAILVQKYLYKEPLKRPLGISFKLNRWFLVAWFLPPIVAFATIGVSLLFPGVEYSPEMAGLFERFRGILSPEQLQKMESQRTALPVHPIWIALAQGLGAGITINAVAGFGEELGWRGFLQREFKYMGFWRASTLIGTIWGVWHIPIILQGHNYPQHPIPGAFMMIVFCLLLAPIFSYIRLKAKSVIAAAIIHGSLNATAGLAIMVVKGGNDLLVGVTGVAGFIILAIINLFIFIFYRFIAKESIEAVFRGE